MKKPINAKVNKKKKVMQDTSTQTENKTILQNKRSKTDMKNLSTVSNPNRSVVDDNVVIELNGDTIKKINSEGENFASTAEAYSALGIPAERNNNENSEIDEKTQSTLSVQIIADCNNYVAECTNNMKTSLHFPEEELKKMTNFVKKHPLNKGRISLPPLEKQSGKVGNNNIEKLSNSEQNWRRRMYLLEVG